MPAGIIVIAIFLIVLLLSLAVGLFLWVNRPVRTDHQAAVAPLPLFAGSTYGRGIDDHLEDDEAIALVARPTVPGAARAAAPPPRAPSRSTSTSSIAPPAITPDVQRNISTADERFAPPVPPAPASPSAPSIAASASSAPVDLPLGLPVDLPAIQPRRPAVTEFNTVRRAPPPPVVPPSATPSAVVPSASRNGNGNGSGSHLSHPVTGTQVDGHSVRFNVPADGTLQFLPGRLEIISGGDAGREIRFVHVPGTDGDEVTFGRSEGAMYRHIQLHDLTVSRRHATMRLMHGQWHLTNLSVTNPVVHNGRTLGEGEQQPLEDTDRIEMGEVVFRFKSR